MRIRLTTHARADVLVALAWWRRNREKAPRLLAEELRDAKKRLLVAPRAGIAVPDEHVPGLRRLALVRTRYFLFYVVDESQDEIVLLRLWHASRGHAPSM